MTDDLDEPIHSFRNPFFKEPEIISLKRGVDILNKFGHKTGNVLWDQHWIIERGVATNQQDCYLSEFEVVAIAEKYEREVK